MYQILFPAPGLAVGKTGRYKYEVVAGNLAFSFNSRFAAWLINKSFRGIITKI